MSRDRWASSFQTKGEVDVNNPEQYIHVPLAPKTSDPEALNFDKAAGIFQTGLRNVRVGDLQAACLQIAQAFLLDGRSVKFVHKIPPGASAEVEVPLVDSEILCTLIESDHTGLGSQVMKIILGYHLGHLAGGGQTVIAAAMQGIDLLLGVLEMDPCIECPECGIFRGYLTRARLFYLRATFQMIMGNMKRTIKDLSSSLKCDPSYTKAREARARLWASSNLKNDRDIHREYLHIVKGIHPDSEFMEVSYAWLALTTLRDPTLGTLAEAKEFYKKSIQASIREREIYGEDCCKTPPSVISILKSEFEFLRSNPTANKIRQDWDKLAAKKSENGESFFQVPEVLDEDKKHLCLACGKREQDDGSKLMKCGRCKSVSYCSHTCQVKDWKEHKSYCSRMCQVKDGKQSYCKIAATKPEEDYDDVDSN